MHCVYTHRCACPVSSASKAPPIHVMPEHIVSPPRSVSAPGAVSRYGLRAAEQLRDGCRLGSRCAAQGVRRPAFAGSQGRKRDAPAPQRRICRCRAAGRRVRPVAAASRRGAPRRLGRRSHHVHCLSRGIGAAHAVRATRLLPCGARPCARLGVTMGARARRLVARCGLGCPHGAALALATRLTPGLFLAASPPAAPARRWRCSRRSPRAASRPSPSPHCSTRRVRGRLRHASP